jgi:hypothetical protein
VSLTAALGGAQEVAQHVLDDTAQPGAEGAGPAVVPVVREPAGRNREGVLQDVVDVGRLQAGGPQPGPQQVRVQRHHPLPGVLLAGAEPLEQAQQRAG